MTFILEFDMSMRLRLAVVATVLGFFVAPVKGQFTPGNLAVLRVGDGINTLSSSGAAGQIYQFSFSGQVVDTSGAGSAYTPASSPSIVTLTPGTSGIVFSGSATSDGHLNLSIDGSTLTLGGYANTIGGPSVVANSTSKTLARISADGTTTYQQVGTMYSANNLRSVVSIDGSRVWTAGANTGVLTVAPGDTTPTTVSTTSTNNRAVEIYGSGNHLFVSTAAGSTHGIYDVGAGPPTTTATATNIISLGSSGNANGFFMTNRGSGNNYAGTGLDTAYLAVDSTIRKYEYNGTAWVARGQLTLSNPGGGGTGTPAGFALTGRVIGGDVQLIGTFDTGSTTNNNYLYSWTDVGAVSALGTDLTGTVGTSAAAYDFALNAGDKYTFRGVDFAPVAPVPEPGTVLALSVAGLGALGLVRQARAKTRK